MNSKKIPENPDTLINVSKVTTGADNHFILTQAGATITQGFLIILFNRKSNQFSERLKTITLANQVKITFYPGEEIFIVTDDMGSNCEVTFSCVAGAYQIKNIQGVLTPEAIENTRGYGVQKNNEKDKGVYFSPKMLVAVGESYSYYTDSELQKIQTRKRIKERLK